MSEIVVGIAASHTPQLSSGVDLWQDHADRDRARNRLLGPDGRHHTYDELLARAGKHIAPQLTREVWEAKYARAQECIADLTARLAEARADVAVVIGDDQWEMFQDEGVPAFALYEGDTLFDEPKPPEVLARTAEGIRAAQWAAHGETRATHRIESGLAGHLLQALAEAEFDIHRFRTQREDRTLGHAFTFPRYRLGLPVSTPIVPLFINTYFPPNVPGARRCYDLGRALGDAVASWDSDARVAVITSGGLSHFVVNEELDRRVLRGVTEGRYEAFGPLGRDHLRDGNSEILNWVTAAGALRGLRAEVVDYLPGYRSPAGTGTGMAFAHWS